MAIFYRSTAALPFGTIVIIFIIWAVVTFPLTVLGGIAGKNTNVSQPPDLCLSCGFEKAVSMVQDTAYDGSMAHVLEGRRRLVMGLRKRPWRMDMGKVNEVDNAGWQNTAAVHQLQMRNFDSSFTSDDEYSPPSLPVALCRLSYVLQNETHMGCP